MEKPKLTTTQQVRFDTYGDVKEALQGLTPFWCDEETKTDAHLFMSIIKEQENGYIYLTLGTSGSETSLIQLFMQTVSDEQCPVHLKKAILVAAANIIDSFKDRGLPAIAGGLFTIIEEKFGTVYCDCPNCRGKKFHQN